MSGTKKIKINYKPQPYQEEIRKSQARFKVVIRGRRGGKTEEQIQGIFRDAVQSPGLHWLVAPFYNQIKSIAWARLKSIVNDVNSQGDSWKINEQELYVEHPNIHDEKGIPTRIELKGADKEDRLVGVGLRSLRVDEAALIKPDVWPKVLRPMLSDHKAPAYFYSTPRGRNWLYDLYQKGQNLNDKDWESWRQPTSVNSFISPDEIEGARKDMSERVFRQEYLAEFIDGDNGVFKGVRRCTVGELKDKPIEGRFYVMGVDLAKSEDFTVLTVIDSVTREVVAFERFNNISWVDQKELIQGQATKWNNALSIIDATGVGDAIYDDLEHSNISVEPFKFTNTTKNQLVDKLRIAIERRLITFPNIPVLVDELNWYEQKVTERGAITYSAPAGKHDDCVMSLGLAVWGIKDFLYQAQAMSEISGETEFGDRVGAKNNYSFDEEESNDYIDHAG